MLNAERSTLFLNDETHNELWSEVSQGDRDDVRIRLPNKPVVNKNGKIIGVTQVLNKRGGPFTADDEAGLGAFTAQVSIAPENAKLFADVQGMKNYNEAMLESMSNGLITLDQSENIVTCSAAGLRILDIGPKEILHKVAADFFSGTNAWVVERIRAIHDIQQPDISMDASLEAKGKKLSLT